MINPHPSEKFPPPPRFSDNSPDARFARMVRFRLRFLAVLFVIGVILLAIGLYTAGGIMTGWAVVRAGMVGWRVRARRHRARGLGGP
jgi:hypothetical protein